MVEMVRNLRIALAQIDTWVGDFERNTAKVIHYIEEARRRQADIVCFPEMALTGYPAEDLLLKPSFISDNLKALEAVVEASRSIIVIVGFVDRDEDIYNAAALIHDGKLVDVYHKHYLPNYGVFDENRYFQSGSSAGVYKLGDFVFGVNICEDIWYPGDPTRSQAVLGNAQVIFNISASPYHMSKAASRERMLATRAVDYSCIVAFTNLVGGQDELVFDGNSVVIDERGNVVARAPCFEEKLLVADVYPLRVFRSRLHDPRLRKEKHILIDGVQRPPTTPLKLLDGRAKSPSPSLPGEINEFPSLEEEVWRALVTGTRDYVTKNGFEKVVIGISGGIDSALVAAIAAEALGNDNVVGLSMPSRYSSMGSVEDAEKLCSNLGIELIKISIEKAFKAYLDTLAPHFVGTREDVTEENLQARIRGNLLMALSNKFGWLVLTTANKSETSVGYTTLYGDMAGGFAVIKDVPKTLVYRLARHYNARHGRDVIPESILTKPPSPELKPDQKDSDTLPPYEVLDPLLKAYVEDDLSREDIVYMGYEPELVDRVIRMVETNEYKRRQAPPGIKITTRAFGKDRRFPITNRYRR